MSRRDLLLAVQNCPKNPQEIPDHVKVRPVKRDGIHSLAYDKQHKTLYVDLIDGTLFRAHGIRLEVYTKLLQSKDMFHTLAKIYKTNTIQRIA